MKIKQQFSRPLLLLTLVSGLSLPGLVSAPPVFAATPWWHLTSIARPTNLNPGLARDEIQQIAVSATGGEVRVIEPVSLEEVSNGESEDLKVASFPYDANPQTVQSALEEAYGAGVVEVTGGPGDEDASKPYTVRFEGDLGDQPLRLINTASSGEYGLQGTATVTESTAGRPDGEIVATAYNLGDAEVDDASAPAQVADQLPPGLRAVAIGGLRSSPQGFANSEIGIRIPCSLASLTCTLSGSAPLAPYDHLEVRIAVVVEPGAHSGELNTVSAIGGGAPRASIQRPITVGGATLAGLESYELTPENEDGTVDTQAGSHPFQTTFSIGVNEGADSATFYERPLVSPAGTVKDLGFKLPVGMVGNATALPHCSTEQFFHDVGGIEDQCSAEAAVGVATVIVFEPGSFKYLPFTVPVFNVEPRVGEPARFGFFLPLTAIPVLIDTSVRTGGDYGVTGTVANITQTAGFLNAEVSFWGVPGASAHDSTRGWGCLLASQKGHEVEGGGAPCHALEAHNPPAFLTLPTNCTGAALQSSVEGDFWSAPQQTLTLASTPLPALDGCNRLPFAPSLKVVPDGQAGSTPTGLTVDVHVPQAVSLDGEGLAESDVKSTAVALPEGMALNPGGADGLQACSEAPELGRPEGQIGLGESGPSSCPEASKVGTVVIKTPLLPNVLEGSVYLAAQNANPFGSLVALYIVAEDPVSGTRVKLAGEVVPNPVTGQLVTTFKDTPQLPFEDFELHFFGGSRAPLSTPALCGSYTTSGSIEGWAGSAPVTTSSTFDITSGPNGAPCADPLPFAPSLTAGTASIQAGGFSPFTTTMSRPDGSQNLQSVQLHMPPGLLGTLSSVKLCGEAQANAGTCGPESLVGHTIVSVGIGGNPYTVTGGEVFITEGYEGAPYGLSIVNPAVAGPFNLGKVIVRAKIEVDPTTAALTVTTNPSGPYAIPQILDGIPLQIQHISVTIDRRDFTFNPTNCTKTAIGATLSSSEGASAGLSVPFQVANCSNLAFQPRLAASTSGRTSKAYGASLHVKLTYPDGPYDANIAKVKVDLPKQLPSRLTTLQKACTAKQFQANPAGCPAESIVGHARATTPVLPVPLEGPAYFVSHGGEAFPSLIVVLQGYGTTVDLVGSTFISKAGVTSSTFKQVPDVPVGTFELTLPEGKFSALAPNGNLCQSKLAMPTAFVGQNGAEIHTSTPISVTGCTTKVIPTKAQKLAKALKACTKHTKKGKRAACEKLAHRKYRQAKKK
jgi:hypothetical protein